MIPFCPNRGHAALLDVIHTVAEYCYIFSHAGIYYPGQIIISFLPMFHIYGLVVLGSVIHSIGVKLVIMSKFDIDDYLGLLQKYKVTFVNFSLAIAFPSVLVLVVLCFDLNFCAVCTFCAFSYVWEI